jgi:carboxylate-amine ligase
MIVDPQSLELVAGIETLLAAAAGGPNEGHVKSELMQSVVEITTPVCATAGEIAAELGRLRRYVGRAATAAGLAVASAGTHPLGRFEQQAITDEDRYRAMVDEFQLGARQQLIFGLHLHVAVDDADTAIRVVDAAADYLAELLALSANSPFWRGAPTGLHSYRQTIFATLPRTGIPPRFGSYDEFVQAVERLEWSGLIPDYTRIWWDVRPHPRLGTVELRVCDAVTRVDDVVALAAYFQSLVAMLCDRIESGRELPGLHPLLCVENKWLAARYGLEARVVDPAGDNVLPVPVSELVRRRLRELAPYARALGCERELEATLEILARGNGAEAQLRAWEASGDLTEVTRLIVGTSELGPALAASSASAG